MSIHHVHMQVVCALVSSGFWANLMTHVWGNFPNKIIIVSLLSHPFSFQLSPLLTSLTCLLLSLVHSSTLFTPLFCSLLSLIYFFLIYFSLLSLVSDDVQVVNYYWALANLAANVAAYWLMITKNTCTYSRIHVLITSYICILTVKIILNAKPKNIILIIKGK